MKVNMPAEQDFYGRTTCKRCLFDIGEHSCPLLSPEALLEARKAFAHRRLQALASEGIERSSRIID